MEKKFESLLIEHCSPTLAGVKTANLFCYGVSSNENIYNTAAFWNKNFEQYGIRINVIKKCCFSDHYLIYVYREKNLVRDFKNNGAREFLAQNGYENCSDIQDYLTVLSEKLSQNTLFPHEIGLFLGYPLNDVIGFIKNKGRNYYFCGFWKVYGNPQEAIKCFGEYKRCTDMFRKMYQNGKSIIQLTVAA